MDKRKVQDPQTARFIRRQQKNDAHDEEEDQQDANFFQDPTKAVNRHAKQRTQKNIQKQVQYFGNIIQPFHMREQEELGDIDEQGFFVFNRKNRTRDAWLDSIGEGDDNQIADQLVKKIKKQSRFQSVYEGEQKLNKNLGQNQQQQQSGEKQEYEGGGIEEAPEQEQNEQQNKLSTQQLIELILSIIPEQVKTNVNNYMKKLKKQKNMDQYNKLLTICNQSIEKTGSYDLLTKKREQLEEMLQEIIETNKRNNVKGIDMDAKIKQAQQRINDWDNDSQSVQKQVKQQEVNKKKNQVQENESDSNSQSQQNDNDNIF